MLHTSGRSIRLAATWLWTGLHGGDHQHDLLQTSHELVDALVVAPRLSDELAESLDCEGNPCVGVQLNMKEHVGTLNKT